MADQEQINRLIKTLSERTGTPEAQLRAAVQNGDYGSLLSRMDPAGAQQAAALLGDENKAKQFLRSPQAKALLKRLMG